VDGEYANYRPIREESFMTAFFSGENLAKTLSDPANRASGWTLTTAVKHSGLSRRIGQQLGSVAAGHKGGEDVTT
jgi:hypothetical protein